MDAEINRVSKELYDKEYVYLGEIQKHRVRKYLRDPVNTIVLGGNYNE